MKTLKGIGLAIIAMGILLGSALYGESKLPRSEICEINYRMDGTWTPRGWKVEDGFPRTDCKLPEDRFTEEDGTWDWK